MPNWIENKIIVKGEPERLTAFIEAIKGAKAAVEFNRLIPMPEILRHTGYGFQEIDGQKVRAWYVEDYTKEGCERGARLFTPEEEVTLRQIGDQPNLHQYTEEMAGLVANLVGEDRRDTLPTWHSWSVANWGTKWEPHEPEIITKNLHRGSIKIHFETAWSPPTPIIDKMEEMFPELSFTHTWRDEM